MPPLSPHDASLSTSESLLAARHDIVRLGRQAFARARQFHGDTVLIREIPESKPFDVSPRARLHPQGAEQEQILAGWPERLAFPALSCVSVEVPPGQESQWLIALASWSQQEPSQDLFLAPHTTSRSGTLQMWLLATARLCLPKPIRIAVRHDLAGPRIAQLSLNFGADSLAGPIFVSRSLPLAGVTRPNEATRAGLATLIEQTGLKPPAATA